jgi:hypothetical protein
MRVRPASKQQLDLGPFVNTSHAAIDAVPSNTDTMLWYVDWRCNDAIT